MSEQEGVSIESLGDDLYTKTMELVSFLTALDPPVSTPEGKLLTNLAAAVEMYERDKFGGLIA